MTRAMFILLIFAFSFIFAGYIVSFKPAIVRDVLEKTETEKMSDENKDSITQAAPPASFNNAEDETEAAAIAKGINESNVEEFLADGKAMTESGDYKTALKYYDAVILAVPSNIRVYSNRAAVKMYMEDYAGAILDCDTSIKIAPERMNAYVNRAGSRLKIGDISGAEADADVLIEKRSFLVEAYKIKGYIEYKRQNYFKSVENFEKAIEIDPNVKNDRNYQLAFNKIKKGANVR